MSNDHNIINIDGCVYETSKGTFRSHLIQQPSVKASSTNIAHLIDFVSDTRTRRVCLWIPEEETALDSTWATLQKRVDQAIQAWIESAEFESNEHNFLFLDNGFTSYNPHA